MEGSYAVQMPRLLGVVFQTRHVHNSIGIMLGVQAVGWSVQDVAANRFATYTEGKEVIML